MDHNNIYGILLTFDIGGKFNMFNHQQASKYAKEFSESLPPVLRQFKDEIESLLKTFLNHVFEQLSLVSREEFDRQNKVLEKTRAKLEALEKKLDKAEQTSQES